MLHKVLDTPPCPLVSPPTSIQNSGSDLTDKACKSLPSPGEANLHRVQPIHDSQSDVQAQNQV